MKKITIGDLKNHPELYKEELETFSKFGKSIKDFSNSFSKMFEPFKNLLERFEEESEEMNLILKDIHLTMEELEKQPYYNPDSNYLDFKGNIISMLGSNELKKKLSRNIKLNEILK